MLTASLDGSGPATFGAAGAIGISVRDGSGTEVASFTPAGLGPEKALLLIEVYRRQGAWKVRAVGQGYASGLAGIATDFGISVDEPGRPRRRPLPRRRLRPRSSTARRRAARRSSTGPRRAARRSCTARRPASRLAAAAPPGGGMVNLDKGRVSLRKGQSVSLVKTGPRR